MIRDKSAKWYVPSEVYPKYVKYVSIFIEGIIMTIQSDKVIGNNLSAKNIMITINNIKLNYPLDPLLDPVSIFQCVIATY